MKKKFHPVRIVLCAVLVILAVFLLVNRYSVRQVWCNLTSPTIALDENAGWEKAGKVFLNVPYAEDSPAQYVDIYVPEDVENPPLFVLVHGGGFAANDAKVKQAQLMYRYFRDHGFACASVNYRLSPEAAYPAACGDVKACVRYLVHHAEEYGYDAGNIAIWGESAGGYLATMTAVSAPEAYSDVRCIGETETETFEMPAFDALVDYYGCIDFKTMQDNFREEGLLMLIPALGNTWSKQFEGGYDSLEELWLRKNKADWGEEELINASPLERVKRKESGNPDLKVKIVHGDADITVSHLQSVALAAAFSDNGTDVAFSLVPGCKHADDRLYSEEKLAEVEAFLRSSMGL